MSWKGASSLMVNFAQSMHMFMYYIIVHVGHYDYISNLKLIDTRFIVFLAV